MRSLAKKWDEKDAIIVVVEQKEPHAGRMAFADVVQPECFEERRALAVKMRDELQLPMTILVDGMEDLSRALFSDLPSPAFVIDRDGVIRDKLPWADPVAVEASVAKLVKAAAVPAKVDGPWTLAQRTAVARWLELRKRSPEAIAWIDSPGDPPPCVPPTLGAVAEARLARAAAVIGDGMDEKTGAALKAAEEAAVAAWAAKEKPRLIAAYVELAELSADDKTKLSYLVKALERLEARAPKLQRAWLEGAIGRLRTPTK